MKPGDLEAASKLSADAITRFHSLPINPFATKCALSDCTATALPGSKYCEACRNRADAQSHYKMTLDNGTVVESLDLMKANGWYDGFCAGSALKYLLRANHKGDRNEDLRKARFYINELLGEGERK